MISIGDNTSELYRRTITKLEDYEHFYRRELTTPFQQTVKDWKLYLADRDDFRKQNEKWRANVHVPWPYTTIETWLAAIIDIFTSPDPMIEPEAVKVKDEAKARGLTIAYDYVLRANIFRQFLTGLFRSAAVQGTEAYKLVWENDTVVAPIRPTEEEIELFSTAVSNAVSKMGVQPPPDFNTDPEGFNQWRQVVNATAVQQQAPLFIPEPPFDLKTAETVRYRGPRYLRVPIHEMRFDPRIECWQKQPVVMHRMVKPISWVLDKAEQGVFDMDEVLAAMSQTTGEVFTQWQNDVATMMGLSGQTVGGPVDHYRDACELIEMTCPEDKDVKYAVVLNRRAIINPDPTVMPYWHQQHFTGIVRQQVVPNFALGMSALHQTRPLFHEMNTLRNLRLDAVTLAVLPIFLRQAGVGLTEMEQLLKPGLIIPVTNVQNAVAPLTKPQVPEAAFRTEQEIKNDVDEAQSTYSNLKGAPSAIGRVSATDTERRHSQALSRIKLQAGSLEDDLSQTATQIAFLIYQKGDAEYQFRVVGDEQNPFVDLKREDFLEAIQMDYRFRGATKALNRDSIVQQITAIVKEFATVMAPKEMRSAGLRVYETSGLKGKQQIFTDEAGETLQQVWEGQNQLQIASTELQLMQVEEQLKPYRLQKEIEQLNAQVQELTPQAQAGDPEATAQLQQLVQQLQAKQQELMAIQQQQMAAAQAQQGAAPQKGGAQ